MSDTLISTIDISNNFTLVFSTKMFKGVKYVSISKVIYKANNQEPKFIGGVTFTEEVFLKISDLVTNNTEDLLDPSEKKIGEVVLKSGEVVVLAIVKFEGKTGIDLRKNIEREGVLIPTYKGVRVPIEEADSFLDSMEKVEDLIKKDFGN